MEHYIFTFTAAVMILVTIKFVVIALGNDLTLPNYKILSPSQWWILYPSLLWQVWYWSAPLFT